MPYTPNPILLAGATPAGGLTLEVTAGRGDLAGCILLGQHGPPCAVEVSTDAGATWQPVAYPHTLAPGRLRLTREDTSPAVSTLRALAALDEGAAPEPPSTQITTFGPDDWTQEGEVYTLDVAGLSIDPAADRLDVDMGGTVDSPHTWVDLFYLPPPEWEAAPEEYTWTLDGSTLRCRLSSPPPGLRLVPGGAGQPPQP